MLSGIFLRQNETILRVWLFSGTLVLYFALGTVSAALIIKTVVFVEHGVDDTVVEFNFK